MDADWARYAGINHLGQNSQDFEMDVELARSAGINNSDLARVVKTLK